MSQTAHLELDGRVAHVVIDNPASRNGLTGAMAQLVADHVAAADADPNVRCIVLRGAGGHFCSGADLKHAAAEVASRDAERLRAHVRDRFHSAVRALNAATKPTLAAIRGACVGFGFDLMLHCDLRLASHRSKFGQVFSRIGLVPDGGSSFALPRLVGLGRAMEMMLLAETFGGEEAAETGLVNRSVPDDELDALVADWADRLASGPPLAYRLGKANLLAGAAGGTLEDALHREVEAQVVCLQSGDVMRGVQAFFTKKKPAFEGS